jgi:putative endonuclease
LNERGRRAEQQAAAFLESRGLRILARNWRCRMGEIDLVAADAGTVVFAEVRARASRAFGGAAESIDRAKRRKLIAAASLFLSTRNPEAPCRFDALLLDGDGAIEWIRDAFRPD